MKTKGYRQTKNFIEDDFSNEWQDLEGTTPQSKWTWSHSTLKLSTTDTRREGLIARTEDSVGLGMKQDCDTLVNKSMLTLRWGRTSSKNCALKPRILRAQSSSGEQCSDRTWNYGEAKGTIQKTGPQGYHEKLSNLTTWISNI